MEFQELTWREQEVLGLLSERATNREIAARLHLAESTVKDYVSNILGKLYVKNRRQAVERGKALGLLEPDRKSVYEPKTNLPVEMTPFIGRLGDLEEIREQFSRTRLLTLTGPGGIGKTRLALKAAAEMVGEFEHGSHFVSLAPIHSAEHIIQTIAEEVRFPLSTEENPRHQLLRYLQKRQLLLVMDNYEHLLDGADIVSEILKAAPAVKILATSRERLNLQGEKNLIVGGMALPNPIESEAILDHDAIALFMQSARRARLFFEPSPDEQKKIVDICRMVQGIPLAIELAAAWLHILSLDEITKELDKSFDILSSEKRDMPERHRSIRAVFEHTWSLLQQSQQETFKRLSLFRGGFTRQAAQQVAGASLQTLGAFVHKSVLSYDPDSGRFEIHELLRQYAQERLEMSPRDTLTAHEAHAAYFAGFMHLRWEHLKTNKQLLTVGEIEADLENIRSAWRFHVEEVNVAQLKKYMNGFWFLYWVRGWNHAAVELFGKSADALTKLPGDAETEALTAIAKANQSFFMTWLGLAGQAYPLSKASAETLENLNDLEGLIFAYNSLTLAAYYLERTWEEKEAAERLLVVGRAYGDTWSMAFALGISSMASFRVNDFEATEQFAEASLKLSDQIGETFLTIFSLNTLGQMAIVRGELAKAKECFSRSLSRSKELGFHWAIGNSTKYLGQVALLEGAIPEAETYFLQSLRIAHELGLNRDIVNHLYEFAKLRVAQDKIGEATELLALLLQQPASRQARLGGGRIRDEAQRSLSTLEGELSPESYAMALERGRRLDLDDKLAEWLNPRR